MFSVLLFARVTGCIHFDMLRYFHVSFARCGLNYFRSPFYFLSSIDIYFVYHISSLCPFTLGFSYNFLVTTWSRFPLMKLNFRGLRSRLFIGVFHFSRVNKRSRFCFEGFLFPQVFTRSHLFAVFSRVNKRSRLFIEGFHFRGLTEGPAC